MEDQQIDSGESLLTTIYEDECTSIEKLFEVLNVLKTLIHNNAN